MWNHSSTQIGLIGTLGLQGMLRNWWWKNNMKKKKVLLLCRWWMAKFRSVPCGYWNDCCWQCYNQYTEYIAASSLSDSIVWRFATNCKEPKTWHSFQGEKKECVYNWELSINVTPPKYTTTKSFGPSRKSQRGKSTQMSLKEILSKSDSENVTHLCWVRIWLLWWQIQN